MRFVRLLQVRLMLRRLRRDGFIVTDGGGRWRLTQHGEKAARSS